MRAKFIRVDSVQPKVRFRKLVCMGEVHAQFLGIINVAGMTAVALTTIVRMILSLVFLFST